jgi:Flp pilus assembly protein TadB
MKASSKFRLSGWVTGSLFALVVANFFLMLFVAGADVFLGQPPQLMVPLFALMFVSVALRLSRRRKARVESYATDMADSAETAPSPRSRRSDAPAYVAMTIIRRPPVMASAASNDNRRGVV